MNKFKVEYIFKDCTNLNDIFIRVLTKEIKAYIYKLGEKNC